MRQVFLLDESVRYVEWKIRWRSHLPHVNLYFTTQMFAFQEEHCTR